MRFSLGKWLLPLYTALALILLLIPIGYTFVFSFNDYFKTNIGWQGFTFDNWTNVCDAQGLCSAFGNSLIIGVVSTVLATAMGTALALALARYKFRGRSILSLLIFVPMATPEVVLAAGLAFSIFKRRFEMIATATP
jgi:spermidine/putrescine transport system permease protein